MNRAWLCYKYEGLMRPKVDILFVEPDDKTSSQYQQVIEIVYTQASNYDFPVEHDLPFFLNKQAE